MSFFGDLFQSADWKKEKHVPVIEAPATVKKGEVFDVRVSVGKELAHPNKTEHHIRWVAVYFHPKGSKFPYQIGKTVFAAHGESTEGPDTSGVYTHHQTVLSFKTDHPGSIHAASYCNIHGLWESMAEVAVE